MRTRFIFFFFLLSFFTACSWTPRTVLPEYFRVIYINKFANDTLQPDLEVLFTRKIIEKFEMDGRLTITDHVSKANGVLFCTITKYKKVPISYTYTGELDVNALTMGLRIRLRDIKTGKWLHEHELEETLEFNLKSEPVGTEIEAQATLMDILVTKIVSKTIEGW